MNKKELKALRRPFLRELFRKNRFSFGMTFLAAVLCAAAELVISWLVKEVPDLISGDCPYSFGTLLLVAAGLRLSGNMMVSPLTFRSNISLGSRELICLARP